jgi:hypothetical protein
MNNKANKPTTFKKGNKASVGHGRPKLPDDIKELRADYEYKITRELYGLMDATKEELEERLKVLDPKNNDDRAKSLSGFEMTALRVFHKFYYEGDLGYLKEMFDRIIGKPKQHFTHSGDDDSPLIIKEFTSKILEIETELKTELN